MSAENICSDFCHQPCTDTDVFCMGLSVCTCAYWEHVLSPATGWTRGTELWQPHRCQAAGFSCPNHNTAQQLQLRTRLWRACTVGSHHLRWLEFCLLKYMVKVALL